MYITPLRWSGGGNKKKFSLLPKEGPRLPPLAALGWIIAYYVEFGKIRGADCRVAALLAMTGRGIDKDLKAGIIIGKRGRCR